MKITRINYEAYFLDYRENNLAPEQVTELFVFLEQNPDLKEEFDSFEDISLVPNKKIRFGAKESLKKNELIATENIRNTNYDEFLVRELDGDLTEDESIELKAFIELNPKTKLEYNIYRSTFMKPDPSVRFEGKEKLKKTGFFVIYRKEMIYGLSIAASVILLLGIYFGFMNKPEQRNFAGKVQKVNTIRFDPGSNNKNIAGESHFPRKIENRQTADIKPSQIQSMENQNRQALPQIADMQQVTNPTFEFAKSEKAMIRLELRNSAISFEGNDLKAPEQKSFASRFIAALAGKVIKIEKPERKSFLEYTIEGYNFMADKEVQLDKKVDENGNVIAYSLNGENISFARNKSKP
jgi:hypothetical protein